MNSHNNIFALLCMFEKINNNVKIFYSTKNNVSHCYVYFLNVSCNIFKYLRNTYNGSTVSLLDITGVDISKLNFFKSFFLNNNLFKYENIFDKTIIYNTLDYKNNSRILFFYMLKQNTPLNSVSLVFANAVWLERELVEFFNFKLINRADTRNLLLDYNLNSNPLLKNYPTEGHQELFFNYLSYNLEYASVEFVEL